MYSIQYIIHSCVQHIATPYAYGFLGIFIIYRGVARPVLWITSDHSESALRRFHLSCFGSAPLVPVAALFLWIMVMVLKQSHIMHEHSTIQCAHSFISLRVVRSKLFVKSASDLLFFSVLFLVLLFTSLL